MVICFDAANGLLNSHNYFQISANVLRLSPYKNVCDIEKLITTILGAASLSKEAYQRSLNEGLNNRDFIQMAENCYLSLEIGITLELRLQQINPDIQDMLATQAQLLDQPLTSVPSIQKRYYSATLQLLLEKLYLRIASSFMTDCQEQACCKKLTEGYQQHYHALKTNPDKPTTLQSACQFLKATREACQKAHASLSQSKTSIPPLEQKCLEWVLGTLNALN